MIHERDQTIRDIRGEATVLANKFKTLKSKNKNLEINSQKLDELDKTIHDKMNALGESIKISILEELRSSLSKVENQVTEVKTSYANAAKASTPALTSGLKTIVKEARYEARKENRDHDNRSKNIIIHGVAEDTLDQSEDSDKTFVDTLVKTIRIPTPKLISVSRIGTRSTGKKRPLKVILGSEKEKMLFLRNLSALRGNDDYRGISVTEDLTPTERSVLKEWTDKAKELNLDDTSEIVYRVRGDSKNGYYLKKFPKLQRQ